jgi:hypothetical protein
MNLFRIGVCFLAIALAAAYAGFVGFGRQPWEGGQVVFVLALATAAGMLLGSAIQAGLFGQRWEQRRSVASRRKRLAAREAIRAGAGLSPESPP